MLQTKRVKETRRLTETTTGDVTTTGAEKARDGGDGESETNGVTATPGTTKTTTGGPQKAPAGTTGQHSGTNTVQSHVQKSFVNIQVYTVKPYAVYLKEIKNCVLQLKKKIKYLKFFLLITY